MNLSIIIPVWQGANMLKACLQAIVESDTEQPAEIICVDNGAPADAVEQLKVLFPQVRLLRPPWNLGFAGGVNAGIQAASGDVFLLLNQDVILKPGWKQALAHALAQGDEIGIVGGVLYNAQKELIHTGATITQPLGASQHQTEILPQPYWDVEYTTGAVMAIRRTVWETIGPLDDNFYPAYYEDADYCYRARAHGYRIMIARELQAEHAHTSTFWKVHPERHAIMLHSSRYRFICKHFAEDTFPAFYHAERAEMERADYFNHILGRVVAARQIYTRLEEVLHSRKQAGQPVTPTLTHLVRETFWELSRYGLHCAIQFARHTAPPPAQPSLQELFPHLPAAADSSISHPLTWKERLRMLKWFLFEGASTLQKLMEKQQQLLDYHAHLLDWLATQEERICQLEHQNHLLDKDINVLLALRIHERF